MISEWSYRHDGKTDGPFSEEQLLTMIEWKTLSRFAHVAPYGTHDWKPIGETFTLPPEQDTQPPPLEAPPLYATMDQPIRIGPAPTFIGQKKAKPKPGIKPAPVWRRAIAVLLDALFLGGATWVCLLFSDMLTEEGSPMHLLPLGLAGLIYLVYEILLPASHWQGTPGKKMLGIRIMNMADRDIGIGRSLWRFLSKWIVNVAIGLLGVLAFALLLAFAPALSKTMIQTTSDLLKLVLYLIAYGMAIFTAKKRALHDYIAGTRVVYTREI